MFPMSTKKWFAVKIAARRLSKNNFCYFYNYFLMVNWVYSMLLRQFINLVIIKYIFSFHMELISTINSNIDFFKKDFLSKIMWQVSIFGDLVCLVVLVKFNQDWLSEVC